MKMFFNSEMYRKIKIDIEYTEVNKIDAADIVVTGTAPVLIDMFSSVKYVICPCTNSDHVEVYNGAKVIDLKGLDVLDNTTSTVEHTIFLLLYLMKRNSLKYIKRDKFADNLCSKHVGIIGYGRIGKKVSDTLRAMGCHHVSFCDTKYPTLYDNHFQYIIKNADVISLHTSVIPDQKPIITDTVIRKLKKKIYLINTSRGSVIDEEALLKNISKFKGVALDVLQNNDNSPYLKKLLKCNNVVLTPHYGGYTQYDVERTYNACIEKLKEEL